MGLVVTQITGVMQNVASSRSGLREGEIVLNPKPLLNACKVQASIDDPERRPVVFDVAQYTCCDMH